jgi:octaprenyl-diphosphate synthase
MTVYAVDGADLAGLEAELRAVHAALTAAAGELDAPLGELVRAQLRRATPALRAALVLAVGFDPSGDATQRPRRVLLAAALEMLYIALHVHRLLVAASSQGSRGNELELSLIGSTILAGDYCFSRAASMAAQTNSPQIVTIFAQALQTVSEGQLRHLFDTAAEPFDENSTLLASGVEAALELAGLLPAERSTYAHAARELAHRLGQLPTGSSPLASLLGPLVPTRRARWQALGHWFSAQHANGQVAAVV